MRFKISRFCLEFLNLIIHSCLFFKQYLTGVSIRIEVASRFEQSNQLYQQGPIRPLLLVGSELYCTPENFRISKPYYVICGILGTILSMKECSSHSKGLQLSFRFQLTCISHTINSYQQWIIYDTYFQKLSTFASEQILGKPIKKRVKN